MFGWLYRFLCGLENNAVAPEPIDVGIQVFIDAMHKRQEEAEKVNQEVDRYIAWLQRLEVDKDGNIMIPALGEVQNVGN